MQVPFIVRYPAAFGKGKVVEQIVDPSVSIMPTILEACGVPCPSAVEGQSLYTLLRTGADDSLNDFVFYQIPREAEGPEKHPYPERGLRTTNHLYVERCGVPVALFDEQSDPDERFNQIENTRNYPLVNALHARLEEVMRRYHDRWDIHADFPPVNFQTHEEGRAYNKIIYAKACIEPVARRHGRA